ncbi:MAG: histidine phosphotransferase [Rhodobacteraceae bacterium]|nr:histidine phosphotransferase [Paracoccaceae bacterium]
MTHFSKTYPASPEMQQMPEALDLAHAITSRMCHDLVSPLGAIANGMELLGMTRGGGNEVDLVGESVATAHARIRLFRAAFGTAQPGQMMAPSEIASLLKDHAVSARYDTDFVTSDNLPRQDIRLLLLVLMCLDTALPWGGTVQIRQDGQGYQITAEAERHRLDPEAWCWLTGQSVSAGISPATVQFPMLALIVHQQGWRLQLTHTAQNLNIRLANAR